MDLSTPRCLPWMLLLIWLAGSTPASSQQTTVILRSLREAGGTEPGLNVRLTEALERFLKDHVENTFQIYRTGNRVPEVKTAAYTLEGDVSYASGQRDDDGRFMLVMRLFRAGVYRSLLAQWTGTADSLRSLTANLRHDSRVSAFGLIGELGTRVITQLTADSASPAMQCAKLCESLRPSGDRGPLFASAATPSIRQNRFAAGEPFRVRLPAAAPARVCCLIAAGPGGEAHLIPFAAGQSALTVKAGAPMLSAPVRPPQGTETVWLVWRTGSLPSDTKEPEHAPAAGDGKIQSGAHQDRSTGVARRDVQTSSQHAPSGIQFAAIGSAGEPPVQVLEGSGISKPEVDHLLTPWLNEIVRNPSVWRVLRLPVGQASTAK